VMLYTIRRTKNIHEHGDHAGNHTSYLQRNFDIKRIINNILLIIF
jgi:hypothetical protein